MAIKSKVTIFLVDDDQIDARAVTRALRKGNIDNPIVVARDGVEALEILHGQKGREKLAAPYVILLDLNMPRMNGLEFLEKLRSEPLLKRSIVFVLTTSNDDRDKCAAYDANVAGYILKARAGADFLHMVSMMENFVITVQFPEDK